MKKLEIFVLVSLFLGQGMADVVDWEMAFQEALYLEQVIGDIPGAMEIYQKLAGEKISRDAQAKVQLRIALCYEKTGQLARAKQQYNSILLEYSDIPTIAQLVNAQIREYSRRKQISQLQKQLDSLKELSPTLKLQLEERIKDLQEKILFLQQKQDKPINGEKASKAKQEEVSHALSGHLYKLALDLYQKGFLELAKENLKNAVSLNPTNRDAQDLLKKVEAMLSHRNAPHIVKGEPEIRLSEESSLDTGSTQSETDLELTEEIYDPALLISRWELQKLQENVWAENLTRIIRQQAPYSTILFQDGVFKVRDIRQSQENLKRFWEKLQSSEEVMRVNAYLLSFAVAKRKFYWRALGGVYSLSTDGIFYTSLTAEQKVEIQNVSQIFYEYPERILLPDERILWDHTGEVPLLKGFYGKSLNFQFHTQGIKLFCSSELQNTRIKIELFVQKLQAPTEIVPTARGPVESPYVMEQKASIMLEVGFPEEFLICGILNPYQKQEASPEKLLLLLRTAPIALGEYLGEHRKTENTEIDGDEFLRSYDIKQWQLGGEGESFILEFLNRQLEIAQFPARSLHIVQDHLIVYGPSALHSKVEKLLYSMREEAQSMCRLSLHLISMEKYKWQELLEERQQESGKGEGLHTYAFTGPELVKQLDSLEGVRFHYTLGPVLIGNTQLATIKNCHILSYMENFHKSRSSLRSNIVDIPEGVIINARPFITSADGGTLEINVAFHRRKDNREVAATLAPGKIISWKIPEVHIERVHAHLSFKQGETLVLSGFHYGEPDSNRIFLLLIEPVILRVEQEIDGEKSE